MRLLCFLRLHKWRGPVANIETKKNAEGEIVARRLRGLAVCQRCARRRVITVRPWFTNGRAEMRRLRFGR